MMRGYMGIVRNRYGVYEARKKVPKRLSTIRASFSSDEGLTTRWALEGSRLTYGVQENLANRSARTQGEGVERVP
jgi:hypothetical protein